MIAEFREAMAAGLAGRRSSLKMLPTFVEQPSGDERGSVAVVDWGGTKGRVAQLELRGAGESRIVAEHELLFSEMDKTGSSAHVFDLIAGALDGVVGGEVRGRAPRVMPLGFVYSYPALVERIDRAIALSLTKGWRLSGLEGQDVAALLQGALDRRGLGRVRVAAVANDTVVALAVGTYRARGGDPSARPANVGLIIGTGTNQAAELPGVGIRNLESGNFDDVGGLATVWDDALDGELADPAPGAQRFEKMAGGHYLGEILRRIIQDLGHSSPLFRWAAERARAPALCHRRRSALPYRPRRVRGSMWGWMRSSGASESRARSPIDAPFVAWPRRWPNAPRG